MNHQAFIGLNDSQIDSTVLLESSRIAFPDHTGTHNATSLVYYCDGLPFTIPYEFASFEQVVPRDTSLTFCRIIGCQAAMECNVEELQQPVNVPVDESMYRLVEEYRYIWSRKLDLDGRPDLQDALSRLTVLHAREKAKPSRKEACLYNRIKVPEGFTYDGASVPRIAWSITGIRPDGLLRAAAAVHDWIYHWSGELPEESHEYCLDQGKWKPAIGRWSRKDADRLFGRMMREAGVGAIKRKLAYGAVRLMGGFGWG